MEKTHASPFPLQVQTVGAMKAHNVSLKEVCQWCGLETKVDLKTIIQLDGPQYSLINKRKGVCRRLTCDEPVRFCFRASGGIWHPLESLSMTCRKCGLKVCEAVSKLEQRYGEAVNRVDLLTKVAADNGCHRAQSFVDGRGIDAYEHCGMTYEA
ncbi:MAG: hypothetical protein AAFY09_15230 [Pseudomonadota bacterium]